MGMFDFMGKWNPFDGSLVNNLADTIGNAWDDYSGVTAAKLSEKASRENTEKQLAWERERATSAHQWEVEDLKKAGLNPVLSAGGSGAVTGGISPQMPDYSSYKGFGALIPLISQFYDNTVKNSNSAKAKAEADLASTRSFTEKTQQILNLYKSGLINEQTAGQAIENEINEINRQWLPWEKGVGIATDVVKAVTPAIIGGGIMKNVGNSAKAITTKLGNIEKGIAKNAQKGNILKLKDGKMVDTNTGEIFKKESGRTYKLNVPKTKKEIDNLPKWKVKYIYDKERGGYWKQKIPIE